MLEIATEPIPQALESLGESPDPKGMLVRGRKLIIAPGMVGQLSLRLPSLVEPAFPVEHKSLRVPRNIFERSAFGFQGDKDYYPLEAPAILVSEEALTREQDLLGIALPNEPNYETWKPYSYSDEGYLITLGHSILGNNRKFLLDRLGLKGIDYEAVSVLVQRILGLSEKELKDFLGNAKLGYENAFFAARFISDVLRPWYGEEFDELIRTPNDSYHHKSILQETAGNPRYVMGKIFEETNWGVIA